MYIDVHCHLTGDEFENVGGMDEVIKRAEENGVARMICSGFDLASSYAAKTLAEKYEKGTRDKVTREYGKVFIYNYTHNRFCGDKQILVFKNECYYDAVIVELSGECFDYIQKSCATENE